MLVPESENKYDKNAVAIFSPTGLVGYLPRDHAAEIQAELLNAMKKNGGDHVSVYGKLVGGSEGKSFGVYLAMPEEWS